MSTPAQVEQEQPQLKRAIGGWLLLLFILGDVLGTGVYALTGKIAAQVGGIVWLPFALAFIVAILTAFSYLELVTKYPKAAGAALYTQKAFKREFFTFVVAFTVMCSGLTSSASASKAFASNIAKVLGLSPEAVGVWFAMLFIVIVALINFRGVSESVRVNFVLTCIELSGLLIVISAGVWGVMHGNADFSRLSEVHIPAGKTAFSAVTAATALAFFAMVGFEDSVNMAEETKNPTKTFPKMLLIGLSLAGLLYVTISILAISLVPAKELGKGDTPLLRVIEAGIPGFPIQIFAIITLFAVANTALLNMMMASRLLYGLANEKVLPPILGKIHPKTRTPWVSIAFTTVLAVGLIWFADLQSLGGTTSLLLLCVFTIVNIAVIILRKDQVEHQHFKTPTIIAVLGAVTAAFLASPLSGRAVMDYKVGGILVGIGVVLGLVMLFVNKYVYHRETHIENIEELDDLTNTSGDREEK